MSISYECYFCQKVFPVERRIDGFSRGYKIGFLCPHCGKNIKDNLLFSSQRLNDCQSKWLNRLFWLSIPFFVASFSDISFAIHGHEISLSAILFAIFTCFAILVLVFVPCTRKAGVFLTEPVNHA